MEQVNFKEYAEQLKELLIYYDHDSIVEKVFEPWDKDLSIDYLFSRCVLRHLKEHLNMSTEQLNNLTYQADDALGKYQGWHLDVLTPKNTIEFIAEKYLNLKRRSSELKEFLRPMETKAMAEVIDRSPDTYCFSFLVHEDELKPSATKKCSLYDAVSLERSIYEGNMLLGREHLIATFVSELKVFRNLFEPDSEFMSQEPSENLTEEMRLESIEAINLMTSEWLSNFSENGKSLWDEVFPNCLYNANDGQNVFVAMINSAEEAFYAISSGHCGKMEEQQLYKAIQSLDLDDYFASHSMTVEEATIVYKERLKPLLRKVDWASKMSELSSEQQLNEYTVRRQIEEDPVRVVGYAETVLKNTPYSLSIGEVITTEKTVAAQCQSLLNKLSALSPSFELSEFSKEQQELMTQNIREFILDNREFNVETDRLSYVCSPYSSNPQMNFEDGVIYCKKVLENYEIPVAPHIIMHGIFDDNIPEEREKALAIGLDFVSNTDKINIGCFGTLTEGMKGEIKAAVHGGKQFQYLANNHEEISNMKSEITEYLIEDLERTKEEEIIKIVPVKTSVAAYHSESDYEHELISDDELPF